MKHLNPNPALKFERLWGAAFLAAILIVLFWRSFLPDFVHFSNDGPLGQQNAAWYELPSAILGVWFDLNDVGIAGGSVTPNISAFIKCIVGPVGYAKFLAPIALLLVGFAAGIFFRALKLTPLATVLGALAAMLNTSFFGDACWGTASHQIALAMDFLALALIVSNTGETPRHIRWLRLALAGLCVGINVAEAADIGALYSLIIAAFIVFKSLT